MYVACLSRRPIALVSRMRSAGALDALSMRTKSVMSDELIRTLAAAVSQHSVSKYARVFTFSFTGELCATLR